MVRLLVRAFLTLLANAAGLYIASLLLDGFKISGPGYVTAVIIFTVSSMVLSPLITSIALRGATAILGATALVTTLVGLIITDVISSDLSISGLDTWVLATLIVWLCSLLAAIILPLFLFKQILSGDKKAERPAKPQEQ